MAGLVGQTLGNYEILALIGEGGMAAVYWARQQNIKREVAIKVIKPGLIEMGDFVKRFEREVETVASLRHAHILKVFDYGQYDDLVYFTMELMEGSLANLIRQQPLDLATASRVLEQIASALDYAHGKGIIHRDLKPANVLMDESGSAFITDFGIAKLLSEGTTLTQPGVALGTPAYMAPEQWQGMPLDARADMYALGVILFEMLSGKQPYKGDSPFAMMNQHIYTRPPSIHAYMPDLPGALQPVIDKALAKDREARFQSGSELVAAFNAAAGIQVTPTATWITAPQPQRPPPGEPTNPLPVAAPRTPYLAAMIKGVLLGMLLFVGFALIVFAGKGVISTLTARNNTLTPLAALAIATKTQTFVATSTSTATPNPSPTATSLLTLTQTGPLPDLTITRIAYVGSTPDCANNPQDAITVANIGNADAGPFVVSINKGLQIQTVNGLAAGQSIILYTSATPSLQVTVDSTNIIVESDKTNNSLSAPNLPIPTQALPCTPTPGSMLPTAAFTPTMTVTSTLTMTATSTLIATVQINPISPANTAVPTALPTTVPTVRATLPSPTFIPAGPINSPILSVAFSPNGKILASGSYDGTIGLWDEASGLLTVPALIGHTGLVSSVTFSPDGKMLASGGVDQTIRLWDVATGKPLGSPLTGHTSFVYSVAFSPDGKILASASNDHTIRLWNMANGQPLGSPLTGHTGSVYSVTFSPDNKILASGGDQTIRLWDVATRQALGAPLAGHTNIVLSVAFSPDGKILASTSNDQTIRLWDVASQKLVGLPLMGHTGPVTSVAFSPDGRILASASNDQTIRLWDVAGQKLIGSPLTGHTGVIYSVAFSPNGKILVSASADKTIRLWDMTQNPIASRILGKGNTR